MWSHLSGAYSSGTTIVSATARRRALRCDQILVQVILASVCAEPLGIYLTHIPERSSLLSVWLSGCLAVCLSGAGISGLRRMTARCGSCTGSPRSNTNLHQYVRVPRAGAPATATAPWALPVRACSSTGRAVFFTDDLTYYGQRRSRYSIRSSVQARR